MKRSDISAFVFIREGNENQFDRELHSLLDAVAINP